jgi:hypothetical protein
MTRDEFFVRMGQANIKEGQPVFAWDELRAMFFELAQQAFADHTDWGEFPFDDYDFDCFTAGEDIAVEEWRKAHANQ